MANLDDTEQHDDSARPARRRPDPRAWLRVFDDGPTGTVHLIAAAGTALGRRADPSEADVLLDDARTSRRHATIALDGSAWHLDDLGSRNGGFVDGAVVGSGATVPLGDGAVIRLGDTLAVFTLDAPAAAGEADHEFYPGVSARASEVRRRTRALAAGVGHALVLGETGAGKERVARRIGDRATFVPQNCAELSRDLARAELFGHVRGAFSGAATARDGLVDAAADGVLFLDEIAELDLDVQAELLRFLEDGSYRPVGSTELRTSRARVVAATNVDLDAAVRAGEFRRDLLARLRATNAPLELAPLRDRREDLPGWADAFLRDAVPAAPARPWTAGALECLLLHPWPENLRELRGVVRHAVPAVPAWPITSEQLPARLQERRRELRAGDGAVEQPEPIARVAAAAPTRAEIEQALAETNGRMIAAAETLGLNRRRLYRLCERLGIDPEPYRRSL